MPGVLMQNTKHNICEETVGTQKSAENSLSSHRFYSPEQAAFFGKQTVPGETQ